MDDSNLIFIVSQPRSGSTLLQHLLMNHSSVQSREECWLLLYELWPFSNHRIDAPYDYRVLKESLSRSGILSDEKMIALKRNTIMTMYQHLSGDMNYGYFIDKTPRYYYILPEIRQIFPKAKIILLRRNPVSVLMSIIRTWNASPYDLRYRYFDDLTLCPRLMTEFMDVEDRNTMAVSYESLVIEPEFVLETLLNWLNLDRDSISVEYQLQFGEGPFLGDPGIYESYSARRSGIDKWKDGITGGEISLARRYLEVLGADLLGQLGYDYDNTMREVVELKKRYGMSRMWPGLVFRNDRKYLTKIGLSIAEKIRKHRLLRRPKRTN